MNQFMVLSTTPLYHPQSSTEKFSGAVPQLSVEESLSPVSSTVESEPAQEEHENMKNLLIDNNDNSKLRRSRAVRSLGRVSTNMSVAKEDSASSQDDATDEIMDRLVKSVTQNPTERASSPKTRKRSRGNRKSCAGTFTIVSKSSHFYRNMNSCYREFNMRERLQYADFATAQVVRRTLKSGLSVDVVQALGLGSNNGKV
ncbi:hypothetical protein cypCar_00003061 [Cyprinus carpio]|nr:hypothetical protein cypCar_00003061 [Cyprinus carpio]